MACWLRADTWFWHYQEISFTTPAESAPRAKAGDAATSGRAKLHGAARTRGMLATPKMAPCRLQRGCSAASFRNRTIRASI